MANRDASAPIYGGRKKKEETQVPASGAAAKSASYGYTPETYNPEIYTPGSFGYSPFSYSKFSYTPYQEKETFNPTQYNSQYAGLIDQAKDAILNREAFSYDYLTDPAYQAYAKQYELGGKQAMKDTLGQVAARTGGVASSYAQAAGQQQYQNYMAQLAAKIPELRQLAYQMYQNEGNDLYNKFNLLQGLDDTAYGRWYNEENDRYNRYNNDRNFDYNRWSDQTNLDYQKWKDETGYDYQNWANAMEYAYKNFLLQEQAKQDAVNARNSANQWNISNRNAAAQAAYEQALKNLQSGTNSSSNSFKSALEQGLYNPLYDGKQDKKGNSIPNLQDRASYNTMMDMLNNSSNDTYTVRETADRIASTGNYNQVLSYIKEAKDKDLIPQAVYESLLSKYTELANRYLR